MVKPHMEAGLDLVFPSIGLRDFGLKHISM